MTRLWITSNIFLSHSGLCLVLPTCPSFITMEKVWKEALNIIKVSISPATFSTWFSQTFPVSIKKVSKDRNLVEVGCPSSFIADTIERRYLGLIQDSLNSVTTKKNDVSFVVRQNPKKTGRASDAPLFSSYQNGQESLDLTARKARLRQGFTFENFAVSPTNQMAWAASDAVSKNPGRAYNPLLLWGGVGVGKTHLMLAIGHKVLEKNPEAKVLYCMGEEFTTEIIEAIREKKTGEFKRRYRNLDMLLLDDVHFIAGKKIVQEEFFHTFNVLLREGGQVVLTSDRPPAEVEELEEKLKSRFEAGLVIDISPPDFELRTAIALIKAQERKLPLSMEAAQTIAANLNSARRIEGFLVRLQTASLGREVSLSPDSIISLLGKTNGNGARPRKHVSPQEVVSAVASYFTIGKRRLLGPNRSRPIALPRQILMYLLRTELGLPLQEVGRVAGGRDHTTVMHAVEKISSSLSTNPLLRGDVLGIKSSIF